VSADDVRRAAALWGWDADELIRTARDGDERELIRRNLEGVGRIIEEGAQRLLRELEAAGGVPNELPLALLERIAAAIRSTRDGPRAVPAATATARPLREPGRRPS
jgi:hypothetical protein